MYCVISVLYYCGFFFFFKQKTAYEMRISDWSSDVCSSDLPGNRKDRRAVEVLIADQVHRASEPCRGGRRIRRIGAHAAEIGGARHSPVRQSFGVDVRSEERRVGKECVSTCRSRGSPYH